MSFVVVVKGPDEPGREIRLVEGETYVGRDPANTLVLDGRGVSRRHAKFVLAGERLTLVDLGSTYGTRVNDVTTLRRELAHGDEITIGMHHMTIRREEQEDPKELPTLEANLEPEPTYFADDVTESPAADIHRRRTAQVKQQGAVQFVIDNPSDSPQVMRVIPRHDSDLMKAVQKLHTASGVIGTAARQAPPPRGAEYQALLLMYRVSELLAAAPDLPNFLAQLADLVLEEVRADTLVLLQADGKGELRPQIIRHRGTLTPGEVPISRGIVDRVLKDKVAVMSNDVGHDDRIKSGQSVMLYKIRAVVALPLIVRGALRGVLYLSRSGLQNFGSGDVELMGALAALVASGLERAELKERVVHEREHRRSLERFHPPEVVERLASAEAGEDNLEEHQATVLVCELADFSSLASRVPPRQLANMLHEYYEMLYEKVFANGGSLVKLHDGWALAMFGAPHSPDRDAVWAVQTAKELCDEFGSVSVLWPGSQALQLHCALDSGTVVAGVLGSAERLEFVAVGEPISFSSALLKQCDRTGVCMTERTYAELPQARYRVEPVGAPSNVRVFRLLA